MDLNRANTLLPFVTRKLKCEKVNPTDTEKSISVLKRCVMGGALVKAYMINSERNSKDTL